MKSPSQKFVAMIGNPLPERLTYREIDCPEIRATIVPLVVSDQSKTLGKTHPINFSLSYDTPKNCNGGLYAQVFARSYGDETKDNGGIFSHYGPDIHYGDARQYAHGARALARVEKRLEEMQTVRGYTQDAAELFGRWLEACGVSEVWAPRSNGSGWLSDTDWQVLTVGEFVTVVRASLARKTLQAV